MVKIVTGKINSEKTSRMIQLFEHTGVGDGYVSIKRMIRDKVHSYEAMRLQTKARLPLIVRDEYVWETFPVACQIGPYLFNQDTLNQITRDIREMIERKIEPIYLDEIGLLELEGKGFDHVVKDMVRSGRDVVLCVREDLLERVLERYHVKDYEIVS
ncbi:MAG: nucleoside-triphosphatase [Candidatus Izemoplasmatales bacterium]|nr:nucleoside-triphosphatase [Candidatus Izemoplasmatales bacterium]